MRSVENIDMRSETFMGASARVSCRYIRPETVEENVVGNRSRPLGD